MKVSIPLLIFTIVTLTSCSLQGSNDNLPDIPGKIVFSAKDDAGTPQIFTMKPNGSNVRQLTDFPPNGGGTQPVWSPDGTRIAFANFTGATTLGPYLYVMNADGSNMRPLKRRDNVSVPALVGSMPAWSPDGRRIAFQVCLNCELGGSNYEISVVEVAGKDFDPGQLHAVTNNPTSDTNPAWSPSGRQIAFTSDRDYFDADTLRFRQDLYTINMDGSNLLRITQTGYAREPMWKPTGDIVTFRSTNSSAGIYNANINTREIKKLETGFRFSGNAQWNKEATQLLVFGRESKQSKPLMKFISIENNSSQILHTITLRKNAVGEYYDWLTPNK